MSSKQSTYGISPLGRENDYRPRVGTSSASEAAAIHKKNRALNNQPNRDIPPTALHATAAPVQSSSTQRARSTAFPRVGTSSASGAAKLYEASRAGSQSRIAADAAHVSDSLETLVAGSTQTTANTARNVVNTEKTYHPTSRALSASKAAAKIAEKHMKRTPAPRVPCCPPVFDMSPGPLSPLVLELGSGPSVDILRRLADIFPEDGSFGDSKSRL